MYHKFISVLLGITSSLFWLMPGQAFVPVPNENGEYTYDEEGNLILNEGFSFSSMDSFTRNGSFEADETMVDMLGYDPSREWSEGDRPEDVLTFGDFQSFGFQNLSLNEYNASDALSISLDQVGIIQDMSLRDLTNSVSGLENYQVKEISLFRDAFPEYLQDFKLNQVFNLNAGEINKSVKIRVYSEIDGYIEETIGKTQTQVVAGISEGIDSVTASIQDSIEMSLTKSTLLDFEAVNTALKIEVQSKIDVARNYLDTEVEQFLQENYEKTATEINDFVNEKIEEYEAEINTVVTDAMSSLENSIEREILAQTDLDLENLDLGEFGQLFDDYKQVVTDFGIETLNTAKAEIGGFVNGELNKIKNVIREIPDDIGSLRFDNFALANYTVGDIPGLAPSEIEDFAGYENATFSEVPGASDYSFDQLPSFNINFGTGIALIDLVFGTAEQFGDRAISGSIRETFNLASCRRLQSINNGCDHIELGGPLFLNRGKQWVSGDSQEVDGGKNFLRGFGGGKEPTGRLPFKGSILKMVLRNNNEQTDTTELFLALQICMVDPLGTKHCTPHNVLEFPVYTFKTGDLIFLGITI